MTGTLIFLVHYISSYYSTEKDYISGTAIMETEYQYQTVVRRPTGRDYFRDNRILVGSWINRFGLNWPRTSKVTNLRKFRITSWLGYAFVVNYASGACFNLQQTML